MKHVSLLVFENAVGSSVIGAMEVFYLADLFSSRLQNRHNKPKIHFDVATHNGKNVSVFSGTPIIATAAVSDIKSTDFIFVSSVWEKLDEMLEANRKTIPWLLEHHRKNAGILAFSTGVFLLAETGLLDGKEATTYWSYEKEFEKRYPTVNLKTDKMITSADNIHCCSGKNAQYTTESLGARKLTKEEAYQLLDECRDAGLVHMTHNTTDKISYLCNCDKWHCYTVQSLLKYPNPSAFLNSGFEPKFNVDNCTACKTCLDRCPANALVMGDQDVPVVDLNLCFGCAVCVTGCDDDSITMVAKTSGYEPPPGNDKELAQKMVAAVAK